MASAQAMGVNEKQQKEMVQQMIEKAKSAGLSKHKNAVNQPQERLALSMSNGTASVMNFNQSHEWPGSIISSSYPPIIPPGSSAQCITSAGIAAVVYNGTNKQGVSCAWLLAWSAPNKVYVECGLAFNFNNIDWDTIKARLDVSGSYSKYLDPVTQSVNYAQIDDSGSFPVVGAYFGVN